METGLLLTPCFFQVGLLHGSKSLLSDSGWVEWSPNELLTLNGQDLPITEEIRALPEHPRQSSWRNCLGAFKRSLTAEMKSVWVETDRGRVAWQAAMRLTTFWKWDLETRRVRDTQLINLIWGGLDYSCQSIKVRNSIKVRHHLGGYKGGVTQVVICTAGARSWVKSLEAVVMRNGRTCQWLLRRTARDLSMQISGTVCEMNQ